MELTIVAATALDSQLESRMKPTKVLGVQRPTDGHVIFENFYGGLVSVWCYPLPDEGRDTGIGSQTPWRRRLYPIEAKGH